MTIKEQLKIRCKSKLAGNILVNFALLATRNAVTCGNSSLNLKLPTSPRSTGNHNFDACGFCHRSFLRATSSRLSQWIQCQHCGSWFHEFCVGAEKKKQFLCGKSVQYPLHPRHTIFITHFTLKSGVKWVNCTFLQIYFLLQHI